MKPKETTLCAICGEGKVELQSNLMESKYKGEVKELPIYFKKCFTCNSEYAGVNECKINRDVISKWRKQVDDLKKGTKE